MGGHYLSVHFRTGDQRGVVTAVGREAVRLGARALVRGAKDGWMAVYPSMEFLAELGDGGVFDRLAVAVGAPHAVMLGVHDDDVLMYRYYRDGRLADTYNSAPDYFGEAEPGAMEAVGNAEAFEGLLDAGARARLAGLIRPRMINGEGVGGETPVCETERLLALGDVLGIAGVMGSYDYLMGGEEDEGTGAVGEMVEVG